MITLKDAAQALNDAGFKIQIDDDTDCLVELSASKDGFSETFQDTRCVGCTTYLSAFKNVDALVAYAEKSIVLYKKQFSDLRLND